ncbi:MAG: hypothetical protein JNJ57_04615 [Saprospiraceae bacterium]|nr:hypothetical protein [Saprospiraceae bacterium]
MNNYLLRAIRISAVCSLLIVCFLCAPRPCMAQPKPKRVFSLDIITTPAMVFIPWRSNLPNYLIEVNGKSELIGLNLEWTRQQNSHNQDFRYTFFTMGMCIRAFGLNWRKDPFNHAHEKDIVARDLAYISAFMGGKFIIRGFERGALNFHFGPGLLLGPALQNDNVKQGMFTTLGLDISMTFSYNISAQQKNSKI